ncbi:MAG: Rieske 2Fe-2S domain-containing protein [Armatimonadetes bacterium]|nr:Rieske 2Fe-2S domain-containing protein [Armatimonadota bacterium]
MTDFVRVAEITEIPPGAGKAVEAGGRQIALFNVDGEFYAIDGVCAHKGGPLGDGDLEERIVTCPWHGWQYDVTTGANVVNPEIVQRAFEVRVVGRDILVAPSPREIEV